MKISTERPPIWDEAHKHFEIDDKFTVYTYGDVLHNPANIEITYDLFAHEATHMIQQGREGGPEAWWRKYFDDVEFRMAQEVEAYASQWQEFKKRHGDRNVQWRYLVILADFLSSPLYHGNLTKMAALSRIQHSPTPFMDHIFHRGSGKSDLPEEGRGERP